MGLATSSPSDEVLVRRKWVPAAGTCCWNSPLLPAPRPRGDSILVFLQGTLSVHVEDAGQVSLELLLGA